MCGLQNPEVVLHGANQVRQVDRVSCIRRTHSQSEQFQHVTAWTLVTDVNVSSPMCCVRCPQVALHHVDQLRQVQGVSSIIHTASQTNQPIRQYTSIEDL